MTETGELSYAGSQGDEWDDPDNDRFEPSGVIAALVRELELIADIAEGSETTNSLPHIARLAREAIARARLTNGQ